MIKQDWLMRQIEMIIQFVAKLVFGRDTIEYRVEDESRLTETDELYNELCRFISAGQIGHAEDMLFGSFEPENQEYIRLAIDFYQRLNKLSDEQLEKSDFSREEISEGLREILKLSGVNTLGL